MSKLYVVMPTLNLLDMAKGAFESVVIDCETCFVLVDQASDDGTKQWAESLKEQLPANKLVHFEYIRNDPRIALAAAWNQGVDLAMKDPECKYIAIINNDIVLHPKTLIHLMRFMDKTGYLMVTADNIKDRMSIDVMKQMELPNEYTDYDCQPIGDWRAEGPDFSCFMISPECVKVIGRFDEKFIGAYCEDQDYHVRIRRAYMHAKQHNDQGVDPERIHAKRLSTAPYYHYASQTVLKVDRVRDDIYAKHGLNRNRYTEKWGGEHPECMDGHGNIQPFGKAELNWRDW